MVYLCARAHTHTRSYARMHAHTHTHIGLIGHKGVARVVYQNCIGLIGHKAEWPIKTKPQVYTAIAIATI